MSKSPSKVKYWLIVFTIIAVSIAMDQASKFLLEQPLATKSIPIIGNYLSLKWTLNYGSAFGLFHGQNVLFFVFFLLGLPLFVVMLAYSRTRSKWGQIGFAFMFGGAVGNAIDRTILAEGFYDGPVRDFISVRGFAIFNIADSFLVVGTIMACLALLFLDSDSVFSLLKTAKQEKLAENNDVIDTQNDENSTIAEETDFLDTEKPNQDTSNNENSAELTETDFLDTEKPNQDTSNAENSTDLAEKDIPQFVDTQSDQNPPNSPPQDFIDNEE